MTTLPSNFLEIVSIAAEAAVQKSIAATIQPVFQHGIVTDVDVDTYIHLVQMDGDTDSIPVHDITHLGPALGTKVTVLFAPPHQAMIIGQPIHDPWHFVGETNEPAFNTGWGNDGAAGSLDTLTMPLCSFRRFGHLVEVRGGALRSSGSSNVIWNLPEWYRPRNTVPFAGLNGLTGHEGMWVEQNGNINHPPGGNGPVYFHTMFSSS